MKKLLRRSCPAPHLVARILLFVFCLAALAAPHDSAPTPLLKQGQSVDWWFVFKFNTHSMPGCTASAQRACAFGGTIVEEKSFSQAFAYASSADPKLQQGGGCVGETTADPLGATFDEVYNGQLFYAVWNDQFDGNPIASKGAPAGHSKGLLAWDNDGNGFVLQVSTPSWPGSGSSKHPRKTDGNTLGCTTDNNILVSQHFFALKLNKDDVVAVLQGLINASVVSDPTQLPLVNNGGPADIQALVKSLGKNSRNKTATVVKLSSGVELISKPSGLHVPPWQMVSALLGGEPLRAATWWTSPEIPSTTADTQIGCWDPSLGKPGAVAVATTGTWDGKTIGLQGGAIPNGNHAKIGVSTGTKTYAIFGDMNQQGAIDKNCNSSQNGRGGMFFVVDNEQLFNGVRDLIQGDTAPAQ
jgi:hypothetical protein